MQAIITHRAEIVDKMEPTVLDNIANTSRSIREKTIKILTKSLDPKNETDKIIFQTLPLELLERSDFIGAIWYIETVGNIGNSISLEILEQVINATIVERIECENSQDTDYIKKIEKGIKSLFQMAQKHPDLKENSKLFLLMGNYEAGKGNHSKAIAYYDTVIEKQDVDGYLASAAVYEHIKEYSMSVMLLDIGYQLHGDMRLLGRLIHLLCKIGKIEEAGRKYQEMQFTEPHPIPFIVYKGSIENDGELGILEEYIAKYITEGSFMPLETLAKLSQNSGMYIAEQVYLENMKLVELNKKDPENLTDEEHDEFDAAILRRLKLMQIDILTLCNSRYIEYYLSDLENFGIRGSIAMRELLRGYFSDNISAEVRHSIQERYPLGHNSQTTNRNGGPNNITMSVFESISIHIGQIGELFFQPEFYDIHIRQAMPILRQSIIQEGDYDEDIEFYQDYSMGDLKYQKDYFDGLSVSIQNNYEAFITQFDNKYGVFFRRQIQAIAIDQDIKQDKYPKVLEEYPDIALLFWMQKMIANQFPTDDPEKIELIVQKYSLYKISTLDALLLGSLLFDISIEYTISFLANYPNMFDIPGAIYIITEGLRSMDKKSRKIVIKDLNELTKEEYDAIGFFEYIEHAFAEIEKDNPTENDKEEILFCKGNINILRKGASNKAIEKFHKTRVNYKGIEGLLKAGDSYEDMGQYESALACFEEALNQDDTRRILIKILNCAICGGNFKKAEKYIQYGLSKLYDISNYILAFHLWQGNVEPALLQMIVMRKEGKNLVNTPEGVTNLLRETLQSIIHNPDSSDSKNDILKAYASFILCIISLDDSAIDYDNYITHWKYINSLSDMDHGDGLHSIIRRAIEPMTGILLDNNQEDDLASSDISLVYLDNHANSIYITYEGIIRNIENQKDILVIRKSMNDFCEWVILTFRKFPDSEKYIADWISKISFHTPELKNSSFFIPTPNSTIYQ